MSDELQLLLFWIGSILSLPACVKLSSYIGRNKAGEGMPRQGAWMLVCAISCIWGISMGIIALIGAFIFVAYLWLILMVGGGLR